MKLASGGYQSSEAVYSFLHQVYIQIIIAYRLIVWQLVYILIEYYFSLKYRISGYQFCFMNTLQSFFNAKYHLVFSVYRISGFIMQMVHPMPQFLRQFLPEISFFRMSDQQFCLKWNNYSTSVTAVFRELLEKEQMCDVTLATKVNAAQYSGYQADLDGFKSATTVEVSMQSYTSCWV